MKSTNYLHETRKFYKQDKAKTIYNARLVEVVINYNQ